MNVSGKCIIVIVNVNAAFLNLLFCGVTPIPIIGASLREVAEGRALMDQTQTTRMFWSAVAIFGNIRTMLQG